MVLSMAKACAAISSVVMPVCLMVILEPTNVSAQSLDAELAIYVLAGIAGLYTLFTCFCFLLALCICCKSCYRKPIKKQPFIEAVESPTELQGTVFENKCYTEDSVKKDPDVTTIKTGADREAIIIANDYAHAVDMIKTCTEHKQKPVRDSPLGRHTPKIITHPVRVPYSADGNSNTGFDEYENSAITLIPWSDSLKKVQQRNSNCQYELELESYAPRSRERGGQAGRRKPNAELTPNKGISEGVLPSNYGLEIEEHRSIPQTSPLPRSGLTKNTDNADGTVTLTKLCIELSSVAFKWYDIGIQLKISYKTLTAIRAINVRNTEICLMRVCEEWLMQERKHNKIPTWSTVTNVLKSEVISETKLAQLIGEKYCSNCSETEDKEESDEEGQEQASKSYTWIN